MRALDPTALDAEAVARAGERLERFATSLPPGGQAALRALLVRAGDDSLAALAALSPEAILTSREVAAFERLRVEPLPVPAGRHSMLTVIVKATRLCNLRCTYCHSWRDGPNQVMGFPVLARTVRDALADPGVRLVEFVWHGGEVTLLPPSYYRKALWLQEQFRRPDQRVGNAVQTNGVRLTDEWLAFLHRYHIEVGVSLDGPPQVHDRRRVDAAGRPTAARVRDGWERLRAAGIRDAGVLLVVDDDICDLGPGPVLDYLLELGVPQVALLNVIPENTPSAAPPRGSYLPLPRFVAFLRELFHLWWPAHADRIVIRELASLMAQLLGGRAQVCVFAGGCFGRYITVEPDGTVSACDKYIGDDTYRFGNVMTERLPTVLASARLDTVRAENQAAVEQMRHCPWLAVCHGGCPHDRYTGGRRLLGYDVRCCGLAPLLEDIADTLIVAGFPVSRDLTAGSE